VIKAFNVDNLKSRVIKQFPSAVYSLPKWSVDNQKIFIFTKNGLESFPSNKIASIQQIGVPKRQTNFYSYKDVFYVLDSNGDEVDRFKPVAGNYLNAVISPDGQRIAFQVVGGSMFVIDIDGTGLVDLGPGERPRWSPDSEWLVYMIPTDDGHQFLGSDIYVIRANGTGKTNLTKTKDQLEMNPDWSPDGQFIAFDEKKSGKIYLLRLVNSLE
jgi:Tol biopolymer transport system component